MRNLTFVPVLLFTSLFAVAANTVVVRGVSVSDSNTYTIEGSGFRPKKGAAPTVTLNGHSVIVRSSTDNRIVCSAAVPPKGAYTLKITNSRGQSTSFAAVIEPQHKTNSAPASTAAKQTSSSDRANQRSRACQIEEVTPGVALPELPPSYCFE